MAPTQQFEPSASVLLPSWRRPTQLTQCLNALARQTLAPAQIIVVWQADDTPTRDAALACKPQLGASLHVVHSAVAGVVAAENKALDVASGEIVLLIDDDAVPPPSWVARHLAHYRATHVGAVGGPAINYMPDGTRLPVNARTPVGRLTWFGRLHGNMHDQPASWQERSAFPVDHLVGYNMSLRRAAFPRFESELRRYWQQFELDACLHVRARGYSVLFDPSLVVDHYPTNVAYVDGREGDLSVKVDNAAYNNAFVLSKHSPRWLLPARFLFNVLVGTTAVPGPVLLPVCVKRYGNARREVSIVARATRSRLLGWVRGRRAFAR